MSDHVEQLHTTAKLQFPDTALDSLKIPTTENCPDLLDELVLAGNASEIVITNLTINPPHNVEGIDQGSQFSVELAFQGPYDSIKTYLDSLLVTDRHLVLECVDLSSVKGQLFADRSDSSNHWLGRVTITAYFLSSPVPAPGSTVKPIG